jgi:CHASE3 domain sensor protein
MRVTRRTSLRQRLYASFLVVFVYVLLLISASIAINYSMWHRFTSMMERNELFANLLSTQSEVSAGFNEALRGESEMVLQRFRVAQESMAILLGQIASSALLSRAGRTHFRIVQNMHDYQAASTARLVERTRFTPDDYIEISFLSRLFGQMNEQAQELAVVEYRANSQRFAVEYRRIQHHENIALVILGFFVLVFGGLAIRSINQLIHSTTRFFTKPD